MSFGDSRVDVDLNPSGAPRIADIKRRTVDLIDTVETTGGENPSGKIARMKVLATTGVEASTVRASKAATQSGHRTTRIVTCRRLVAPAPSGEVQHVWPAAPHDRCPPPRDLNPTRRYAALSAKTASRHTPSISLLRHAGLARAPDAAARWRRSPGPHASSTRPHPRQPGRAYAVIRCAHMCTSRHPVLTRLPHATRGHQTLLHPNPQHLSDSTPARPPAPAASMAGHALESALDEAESAPHAPLAALTDTRAPLGRAMRSARSVRCSIGASATTSCGSAHP